MRFLDMVLHRRTEDDRTVPDRSAEIEVLKTAHGRAADGITKAGILSPSDYRIRRAMITTGRAIRADAKRG